MNDDLDDGLERAEHSIEERFRDVVRTGAQSVGLPTGHCSCGQYLDQKHNAHRGFHGSVAALRVLASSGRADNAELARGLLRHIEQVLPRSRADEAPLPGLEPAPAGRFNAEDVIKQAELLDALRVVPPAWEQTEAFANEVAERLLSGRAAGDTGWSYFTDDSKPPAPLPTAFAVDALAKYGHDVSADVAYLLEAIRIQPAEPQTDVFVQIACLYFLTYLPDTHRPRTDVLVAAYEPMWAYVERLLDFDLEANIEYARPDERFVDRRERGQHLYVRVPWQLYMIGAAAALDKPFRRYRIHRRLHSVLTESASERGFYYPHSGRRLSSRTHGILYDVVRRIRQQQPSPGPVVRAIVGADRARLALATPTGRSILVAVGVVALVVASVMFVRNTRDVPQVIAAGIVAESLAAVVLLVLGGGRR